MNLIIHFVQSFGYPAIFGCMLLTATMIPIPSEVTIPLAGFMAQQGHLNFILVIIIASIGDLLGSLISYSIGYYLEDHIILGLIDKYGKYIFFRKHEYEKALHWMNKYGSRVVFIGKCVPGIRSFISLPAGLAKMNVVKFATYALTGTVLWLTFLTTIGFYLGKNWDKLHNIFSKFEYVIAAVIVIGIAYYIYKHLQRTKSSR